MEQSNEALTEMPAAVVFDLDGTLGKPHENPNDSIITKIEQLSKRTAVGILSAAPLERVERSVLDRLSEEALKERMYVLTVNGAQGYVWSGSVWRDAYDKSLTSTEKSAIRSAFEALEKNTKVKVKNSQGATIVDFGGYIAYTPLGKDAAPHDKESWDPKGTKRRALIAKLRPMLTDGYEIYLSGETSIDITRTDANKAHGIRWLAKKLSTPVDTILFVGDALFEGGNDHVIIATGARTRQVANPKETEAILDTLLTLEK